MANASGPDVSFYQDDDETPEGIDFEKMKERSDFVIIRAGQNQWIDPDFRTNWTAAKKAGLPRGSYWYYDSRIEPQRQAELWRDALGDDRGELPLFADFEEKYGGPYEGWRKWYAFLEYLKDVMPEKEIVVYTGYYYWRENAPDANTHASSLEYFHQYPLWIANYGVDKPNVPAPWGEDEWLLWQYTEHGDGPGYGVESLGIDLNYFNGDAAAFRERFNIPDAPLPSKVKYKVDLSLREGPGEDHASSGTLKHDEIVEKVDANDAETWFKVQREGGQEGWTRASHLVMQDVPTPDPDPNPDPEPLKKWAKVLPATLNVREGASAIYRVVGILEQDQVVKVLEFNEDQSWVKIEDVNSANQLAGWCDARYFVFYATQPDPGIDPEPDPEPDKWYRVNVHALNVRQGPSTQFDVAGTVVRDEVVEKIEIDETQKWFKIRSTKGLVGWVYAYYLVETEAPPEPDPGTEPAPDPDPNPDPAPNSEFLGRFQVTVFSLNVREGASTDFAVIDKLQRDDIVEVVDANEDGGWRKIKKDNLEGWASAQYLVRYPQPVPVNQKYFDKKVRYIREIYESPRKMIVHVLVIDTFADNINFLVTPPDHNSDAAPLCARTTTEFLEKYGMDIAINGDGYAIVNQADVPALSCPDGRDLLNPNSYAASEGRVYSQRMNPDRPILYINRKGRTSFNELSGSVYNAISGDRTLVTKGKVPVNLDNTVLEPRTALGVSSNGRWMLWIVVDGRQPGYSEGCTLKELADMLIKFGGAYHAINFDGGGSSVMVIKQAGKAEVLNSPIEGGIAGKQRLVANHLGIKFG